jgi:hypothetical protein
VRVADSIQIFIVTQVNRFVRQLFKVISDGWQQGKTQGKRQKVGGFHVVIRLIIQSVVTYE